MNKRIFNTVRMLIIFGGFILIEMDLTAQSILWKISGNDLPKPSYILGTHHLAPVSVLERIEGFPEAFHQMRQVVCEVNMDSVSLSRVLQEMRKVVFSPQDTSLRSLLTDEEYQLVNKLTVRYLKKELDWFGSTRPLLSVRD